MLNLAFDLGTTLDIITGVRLGSGRISVHPGKLAVAGHGFRASAAVFTAAGLAAGWAAPSRCSRRPPALAPKNRQRR